MNFLVFDLSEIFYGVYGCPYSRPDSFPDSPVSRPGAVKRALRSEAGTALARYGLAKFYGIDSPRFTRTRLGRPRLSGASPVDFNISHADELAGCLLSDRSPVGVDIERIHPVEPELFERLARDETLALFTLGPDERQAEFFVYWTAKEAFTKAIGVGLNLDPDAYSVLRDEDGMRIADPADGRVWYIASGLVGENYRWAQCSLLPDNAAEPLFVDGEALLPFTARDSALEQALRSRQLRLSRNPPVP